LIGDEECGRASTDSEPENAGRNPERPVQCLLASFDARRSIHHAKHVGIPDDNGITSFRGSDRKSVRLIVARPDWSDPKARRGAQSTSLLTIMVAKPLTQCRNGVEIEGDSPECETGNSCDPNSFLPVKLQ
jgi:hypothetical protein